MFDPKADNPGRLLVDTQVFKGGNFYLNILHSFMISFEGLKEYSTTPYISRNVSQHASVSFK